MSRKTRQAGTSRMQQVGRRIEHWRETGGRLGRMPEPLWAAAMALAREHGVYATAQGLGLSYNSLGARVEGRGPKHRAAKAPRAGAMARRGGVWCGGYAAC